MSTADTKIEQTPVPKVEIPEVSQPIVESADVSLDLEDFKKKTLAEIEGLKDIEDDTKREQKRLDILNTLASKELELKSLKETVGFQKELADLFTSTIDELKEKVENDRKSFLDKTLDKIKDGSSWTLEQGKKVFDGNEWKENPGGNVGRVALGAGIVYGGYKLFTWMFGSDDAKNDEKSPDDKEKKGFWDTWYGKALKWAGIGTGAYTLIDRFMTGKWRWEKKPDGGVGDGLSDIEDVNKAFETLDSKEQEKYNTYGVAVNDFYTDVYAFSDGTIPVGMNDTILGSTDRKLDATTGIIPFMLDGTFGSIADMNSETGLFSLDVNADAHEIAKKLAGMIGNGAGKMAKWILDTIGFEGIIDPANIETQVVDFLTGSNKIEDTKLVFRKILKVISFNNYAENVFINQEVQKLLATGKTLYKKGKPARDGEEQGWEVKNYDKTDTDLIKDIVSHPENYKVDETELAGIKTEVRSHTIAELSAKVGGITKDKIWAANTDIKENIDKINTERDQKHKDLEKDKIGTLDTMKAEVEDELAGSLWSRMQKGMPLFHLIDFGGASAGTKESLKKHAGFQKIVSLFTGEFEKLKSESDLSKIKNKIDMYYATIKEISVADFAVDEIADENGNVATRLFMNAKNFFVGAYDNFMYGITLIDSGNGGFESAWYLTMGSTVPVYMVVTASGRRLFFRAAGGVVTKAAQAGAVTASAVTGRLTLSANKHVAEALSHYGVGRTLLRYGMFTGEEGQKLFKYYYLHGDLSTDAANKLVSMNSWKNGGKDVFDYLRKQNILEFDQERILRNAFMNGRDYVSNPSMRKLIFPAADATMFTKLLSPQSVRIDVDDFAIQKIQIFEQKYTKAGKITKEFLDDFVKNGSIDSLDEFKNVVDNIDKIDESKLVGKTADELTDIFDNMRTSIRTTSFVGIVERARTASEIADIARVKTKLDDALKIQNDQLSKLKKYKQSNTTKLNIANTESNIKKVKAMVDNIDAMDPKQIILFEHVLANTSDTVKAVKLLEVLGDSPEGLKAAEKLFAGQVDEFVVLMKSSGLLKNAGIGDDVLQGFGKGLKFASHMDEALDMAKSVVKILSKVH